MEKETLGQRVIRYMELLGKGKDSNEFIVELSITNYTTGESSSIIDHAAKYDTFKAFIEDGILVDRMNEYWIEVSKRDEK